MPLSEYHLVIILFWHFLFKASQLFLRSLVFSWSLVVPVLIETRAHRACAFTSQTETRCWDYCCQSPYIFIMRWYTKYTKRSAKNTSV